MTGGRAVFRRLAVVLSAAALAALPPLGQELIPVAAGSPVQEVLDAAPRRSTVVLLDGAHHGPLEVSKPLTLVGAEGAEVVASRDTPAAILVAAPNVTVAGLEVRGGWTGIDLQRAPGALISDVAVSGSVAEGIRVYVAPALLRRVRVSHPGSEHAQGIEILSAPDTTVTDSFVSGGKVGIVAHLSEVELLGNRVVDTSLAGIMIREMSHGSARDNVVTGATGAGLYCGDQSRCAFSGNRVQRVRVGDPGRSSAGWGLVVHFQSVASSHQDVLHGEAGEVAVLSGSRITPRSALELGKEWGIAMTAVGVLAAVVILLMLMFFAGLRLAPKLTDGKRGRPELWTAARLLLVVGLVVQTFHMGEHVLQVFRVHWDGVPSRGGLAGHVVETEWVHFSYNALVLIAVGSILWLRRRGWPARRAGIGDRFMIGAALLQGYHVVEHSVKLAQHITTGAKVNPGLLGSQIDLVWLHFTINLAVYAAFALSCAAYLWKRPVIRRARRRLLAASAFRPH